MKNLTNVTMDFAIGIDFTQFHQPPCHICVTAESGDNSSG